METTWCPRCRRSPSVLLDSFPGLCGDCRTPYLAQQMTTWHERNGLFAAAADMFHALEAAQKDAPGWRDLAKAALEKATPKSRKAL